MLKLEDTDLNVLRGQGGLLAGLGQMDTRLDISTAPVKLECFRFPFALTQNKAGSETFPIKKQYLKRYKTPVLTRDRRYALGCGCKKGFY